MTTEVNEQTPLLRTETYQGDVFPGTQDMVQYNLPQKDYMRQQQYQPSQSQLSNQPSQSQLSNQPSQSQLSNQPSQSQLSNQALQAELDQLRQKNLNLIAQVEQQKLFNNFSNQQSNYNLNAAIDQTQTITSYVQKKSKFVKALIIVSILYSLICIFLFGFSTKTAGFIAWTGLAASLITIVIFMGLGYKIGWNLFN